MFRRRFGDFDRVLKKIEKCARFETDLVLTLVSHFTSVNGTTIQSVLRELPLTVNLYGFSNKTFQETFFLSIVFCLFVHNIS